jgi:branched-chain amino acid transport system permease protein
MTSRVKKSSGQISVQKKSSKPAIIFIHGFRGTHLGLQKVASFLKGYKVYTPDIPPFGHAGRMPAYNKDTYADYIARFIRSHRLKKPILVGHSMGSLVAAATAEKYPKLVNKKLILMSPISTKPPRPIANLQPLTTILPNKTLSKITTKYLFVPKKNKKLYNYALNLTIKCGAEYSDKKSVRAATRFSTSSALADFDLKNYDVLLLAGAKDHLIARRKTKKLADDHHYQAVFVQHTGHLINYENPKKAAHIIADFLAE